MVSIRVDFKVLFFIFATLSVIAAAASADGTSSPTASPDKLSFEERMQIEGDKLNKETQPFQKRVQSIQHRLNELYDIENPTFHLYKSSGLAVTLEPSIEYREKSSNPFSLTSAVDNTLSKQRYFAQPAWNSDLPGTVREFEYGAEMVFQTNWHNQPWLRLTGNHIEASKSILRIDTPNGSFHGNFSDVSVGVGNALKLSSTETLTTEISYGQRTNSATDDQDGMAPVHQKITDWGLTPTFNWKKSYGNFLLLPALGLSNSVDDNGSLIKENTQSLGFQWELAPTAEDSTARIFEFGIHRVEDDSPTLVGKISFQPYLSGRWKGLADGSVDVDLGYQVLLQKWTGGNNGDPEQLTAVPKWQVPIAGMKSRWKSLHDLTSLQVDAPTDLTFGGGLNHAFTTSLGAEAVITLWPGGNIKPSMHVSYSRFYETHQDQVGFHFGIGL